MIQQETILIGGRELIKTYSDKFKIRQVETGALYDEAIDVPNRFTYEESEEFIDSVSDTEALKIITGDE